jgi:L-ectoine synthase
MIVRTLKQAIETSRNVSAPAWRSVRLVLADDGIGFSFHVTTMFAGTETIMEYKNHVECVYCTDGVGELEVLATGERHEIEPGFLYALDKHDRHVVRPKTDITIVCVFSPALVGKEIHAGDGSYPAAGTGI